jgi:hypothetical protein
MQGLAQVEVRWTGTYVGLEPTTTGADEVAARGADAVPDLLAALDDPETFVAAHVLLTRASGVRYESLPTWNGLAVELQPDGAAVVDPAQRLGLAERWRRWSSGEPRPERLPA